MEHAQICPNVKHGQILSKTALTWKLSGNSSEFGDHVMYISLYSPLGFTTAVGCLTLATGVILHGKDLASSQSSKRGDGDSARTPSTAGVICAGVCSPTS